MPINTAQAGYSINIGVVGISGAVLGMPVQSLILGGIAGAVVLALKPPAARSNALAAVLTSIFWPVHSAPFWGIGWRRGWMWPTMPPNWPCSNPCCRL